MVKASQDTDILTKYHQIKSRYFSRFSSFGLSLFNQNFHLPSSSDRDKGTSVWERRQHTVWFFIYA